MKKKKNHRLPAPPSQDEVIDFTDPMRDRVCPKLFTTFIVFEKSPKI